MIGTVTASSRVVDSHNSNSNHNISNSIGVSINIRISIILVLVSLFILALVLVLVRQRAQSYLSCSTWNDGSHTALRHGHGAPRRRVEFK